jgi:hypothetical protein
MRDGQLVEAERCPPSPRVHIITDKAYEGLRPVMIKLEQDPSGAIHAERRDISTRQRHRQYMRENNLALYDDFRQVWEKAAVERAERSCGQQPDADVREALGRAAYRVFDAPGIEQRPERPSADEDPILGGTWKSRDDIRDTSYPIISKFIPKER